MIPANTTVRDFTVLTGPLVVRLPANERGRDFVVGDLHGAFFLLECAMQAVNFDPSADRLLSVGDLVDRGADSVRVLDYLNEPYFFAVCGNHDHRLISMSASRVAQAARAGIAGLGWAAELQEPEIANIQLALQKCPLVMEVETEGGMVGLVHADIPMNMAWPDFVSAVLAGDAAARTTALLGRIRARDASAPAVPGIDRVFVGHTTMFGGPVRRANVWMLDTGAIFRQDSIKTNEYGEAKGALAMVNILTSEADFDRLAQNDGPVSVADCLHQAAARHAAAVA